MPDYSLEIKMIRPQPRSTIPVHKRAAHSHTTHHVDVEDLLPRVIGDIGKGDWREDSDIVDEDVDSIGLVDEPQDAARGSEISGDANSPGPCRVAERARRFRDALSTAPLTMTSAPSCANPSAIA